MKSNAQLKIQTKQTGSLPKYLTHIEPFCDYFKSGVPIIMYHNISTIPFRAKKRSLYLHPKIFEQQIEQLQKHRYKSITVSELIEEASSNYDNNLRMNSHVILTFDDGCSQAAQESLPVLKKQGFNAIQYIVADRIGSLNTWDIALGERNIRLMTKSEIFEWLKAGHEIGSHTLSHVNLTAVPLRQAREEILSSKKKLEDTFGISVKHFCYPYGAYNQTIIDLVLEADYESAVTTEFGVNKEIDINNKFTLKRIAARHKSFKISSLVAAILRN